MGVNKLTKLPQQVAVLMVINYTITVLNIFLQTGHLYIEVNPDESVMDQMGKYFELVIAPAGGKAVITPPYLSFVSGSKLVYSYVGWVYNT